VSVDQYLHRSHVKLFKVKIALVHDYLADFGGAERVLLALSELYPKAPIYTAFAVDGSAAMEQFEDKQIVQSWAAKIPGFKSRWNSPLRFLTPWIWGSFDFSQYEVVISSSSWYMTKGITGPKKGVHIAYIHTPPRYLYGYDTSWNWKKYWPVRVYAAVVNKGLRQYDYDTAQRVEVLVANSKEVQARIEKFWRRESKVIYPPVGEASPPVEITKHESRSTNHEVRSYWLTGGRLVAPKHFDLAIKAANKLKLTLKIFGTGPEEKNLKQLAGPTVEFMGRVEEEKLAELYKGAKAFLALAEDEDFGITPVEAMMAGTPVVAYAGGGYKETVVEGETGVLINDLTTEAVVGGIKKLDAQMTKFKSQKIMEYANRFSKERFKQEISELVRQEWEKKYAV